MTCTALMQLFCRQRLTGAPEQAEADAPALAPLETSQYLEKAPHVLRPESTNLDQELGIRPPQQGEEAHGVHLMNTTYVNVTGRFTLSPPRFGNLALRRLCDQRQHETLSVKAIP